MTRLVRLVEAALFGMLAPARTDWRPERGSVTASTILGLVVLILGVFIVVALTVAPSTH